MASCNHNTCPPKACTLTNAIKEYKKARSSVNDASLKPFLKIIECLQAEIACNTGCSPTVSQQFSTASLVWNFTHNLDSNVVVVQVYDDDFNQLIPEVVELVNSNLSLIKFSRPVSGYAIAVGVCGPANTSGGGGGSGKNGTSGTSGSSGLLNLTGTTTNGVITYNGSGGTVQSNVLVQSGYVVLPQVLSSLNFVDDTAAAAGGVPLGGLYRNGNFILIRIK